MTAFTPEAARALGGPDWLVERRLAAAVQLDGITWPTDADEIWRYSRISELDLGAYAPAPGAMGDGVPSEVESLLAAIGPRSAFAVTRNGHLVVSEGVGRAETLDDLLPACDVLSIHVPLVPATRGLIGADALALMRGCSCDASRRARSHAAQSKRLVQQTHARHVR